jgi:hypothetical protein
MVNGKRTDKFSIDPVCCMRLRLADIILTESYRDRMAALKADDRRAALALTTSNL